ncbi:MAG: ribonuclease HII [Chloroflexota bacterium]|nr:MAG: ribonuclease HII [Chloroflexota bacterium]
MKTRNLKPKFEPPSLVEENGLNAKGYRLIAGVDEAGRGALAGPVVAAAVILPQSPDFPWLKSVRDSKETPPARRELLFDLIKQEAIAVSVGIIAPQTIDVVGILNATKIAMCHAVEQLDCPPDFLLIDFLRLPQLRISQKPIVHGDKICLSIACASIIAKVTRDRIMVELDQIHPGYDLANHKGYGTRHHVSCLHQHGPSPIHRRSFAPVREAARLP